MRLRILCAAVLGLAMLVPAQPAAAQIDTSTPEGQISQVLRDLRIALASDDIDGALKFYWKDPRLTIVDPDDGFKIHGWGEWKQYLDDQRALQKTISWRRRHPNVHVRGDNAFVTFYATRHVQRGSTVFKKQERGTYVLKKLDGNWLIAAQHISQLPPILRFQQTKEGGGRIEAPDQASNFNIEKYFAEMEKDASVYDPASPWIYDKDQWRRRVEQMFKMRQFLDLNTFHRTEVELGDMKIATLYREIRRPEGSFTERLHGRITWVYLKQPDGRWFLWHDHTSEIPEDYQYQN